MLRGWVIVLVSFAYLGVLFAIAHFGDSYYDPIYAAADTRGALRWARYCLGLRTGMAR